MDTSARLKQEQALKKEWLEAQLSASGDNSAPKHKVSASVAETTYIQIFRASNQI